MIRPRRIDQRTADRLVAGQLLPDDVPSAYRNVAALLSEAATPGDAVGPDRELLAAMVEAADSGAATAEIIPVARGSRVAKVVTTKVAVASAAVILSASGAAAATGSLPDAAQDRVAAAASHIGINLPDSASDQAVESTGKDKPSSAGHDDVHGKSHEDHGKADEEHGKSGEDHGKSAEQHGNDDDATTTGHGPEDNHGADVSEVARDEFTDGREHGEEVSEIARTNEGNSEANPGSEQRSLRGQNDTDDD